MYELALENNKANATFGKSFEETEQNAYYTTLHQVFFFGCNAFQAVKHALFRATSRIFRCLIF